MTKNLFDPYTNAETGLDSTPVSAASRCSESRAVPEIAPAGFKFGVLKEVTEVPDLLSPENECAGDWIVAGDSSA